MSSVLGEVRDVSRQVAGKTLLSPVSFTIEAGSCVALEGRNGSGKTTLLRILLGRDAPSGGAVWFDDDLVARRGIAAVMQSPPFFENLTVLEHLEFVQASWGVTPKSEEEAPSGLLRTLSIDRIANSFPDELSSGERQLIALCFSLLRPSALLVLDEPEQRLDVERRALVRMILEQRKRDGLSIVMATHDPEFIAELADTTVSLETPA